MPGSIRSLYSHSQYNSSAEACSSDSRGNNYLVYAIDGFETHTKENKASLVSHTYPTPGPEGRSITMRDSSPAESASATDREPLRATRNLDRGTPGERAASAPMKTAQQKELARKKSQYYGDAFAYREPIASARERVVRESVITAEFKTNVIIQNEWDFIIELSSFLSTRYQRPESSIIVSLSHSNCMYFGGTFDPAYILTIGGLNTQLGPVTNKRNSMLLAKYFSEALNLGVEPSRGVIKFVAVPEDNLAVGGKTMTSEIERLENESGRPTISVVRPSTGSMGRSGFRRRASKASLREKMTLTTHDESSCPTTLATHEEMSSAGSPKAGTGRDSEDYGAFAPPPPPIPIDAKDRTSDGLRVSRRKSFMHTIFRRT